MPSPAPRLPLRRGDRLAWLHNGFFEANPSALQIVDYLAERGIQLLLLDQASHASLRGRHDGIQHVALGATGLSRHASLAHYFHHTVSFRPHVILASHPAMGSIAALAARALAVPFVFYAWELYGDEGVSGLKGAIYTGLERVTLSQMTSMIVPSPYIRDVYVRERHVPANTIHVVPNLFRYAPPRPPGKLRTRFGNDARILLYTGAYMHGRYLPELVELLPSFDRNYILVCAGRNIYPDYWDQFVQPVVLRLGLHDRVFNIGWVPSEALPSYIHGTDVGIVLYDPKPRNNYLSAASRLAHYIAQDVPLVLPPYPYLKDLVDEYEIGILTKDMTPNSIREAIETALHTSGDVWRRRHAATRKVFNWDRYVHVIDEVVLGE